MLRRPAAGAARLRLPAVRRDRLGQDGSVSACDRRGVGTPPAGRGAGARYRAYPADKPALRGALPGTGHPVAQRAERWRALRRMAARAQGPPGRTGGGWFSLEPVPAIPRPGNHRSRRRTRAYLQAGGYPALSRTPGSLAARTDYRGSGRAGERHAGSGVVPRRAQQRPPAARATEAGSRAPGPVGIGRGARRIARTAGRARSRYAPGAACGEPRGVQPQAGTLHAARPGGRPAGHPLPQPARHRQLCAMPRLWSCRKLRPVRYPAHLSRRRRDAALPSLQPPLSCPDPLPGLRQHAHPLLWQRNAEHRGGHHPPFPGGALPPVGPRCHRPSAARTTRS